MPSTVPLPAIALSAASPADIDTDLLAVPVFEGDDLASDLRALDAATGGGGNGAPVTPNDEGNR